MINLHSPSNESELAIIESILESENIPFFIHNNYFGSLQIGPPIDLFNKKTIMIDEAFEERARELLADFFQSTKEATPKAPSYTIFERLRMIFETLIFGWFIPGRHRRRIQPREEETGHINQSDGH